MQALTSRRRLERHREFRNARRAEIVGHAADRNHERVVAHGPRRRDLATLLVERGGKPHFLRGAVKPDHLAEAVAEAVPMRLGEVVDLIDAGIHAAGRYRVQQRLPQMHARAFDQHHARPGAPAEPFAETGRELQSAGAAADHHDPVHRLLVRGWVGPHLCLVARMERPRSGRAIRERRSRITRGSRPASSRLRYVLC